MDADSHAHLRDRLADLRSIDGIDWKSIGDWIVAIRPFIREHYTKHLPEFEVAATRKHAPIPPVRLNQKIEINYELDRKLAVESHRGLVAFIEDLTNIPITSSHTPTASRTSGDTYNMNIHHSNVGAAAIGGSTATGKVLIGEKPTQAEHERAIKEAKKALVEDEDALDAKEPLLVEAFGQFLRLAREIQVEQQSIADTQRKMKDAVDEIWADMAAKGMKPVPIDGALHVMKALSENPLMVEAVKKLVGL